MTNRLLPLLAAAAAIGIAAWLLLRDNGYGERVRFVVYLDRAVAPGTALDGSHTAKDSFALGTPGDVGLACPQSERTNPAGFRTFANGTWHLSPGELALGQRGDLPFCADFNGDGLADSGVFRDGAWFVTTKRDGVPDVRFSFGAAGDRPVVLNVKGAGNNTDRKNVVYGVYRRGMWYLDTHGTGAVDAAHAFGGLPQDVPLLIPRWSAEVGAAPGYSLAIFRDGAWHIKPDPDGAQTLSFSFGAAGDQPGFIR